MTAFCKLVILLVTLVSFTPPRSSVSALKCIRCVAVEGGMNTEGAALVDPKGRKDDILAAGEREYATYRFASQSEDNDKCLNGEEELEAICDVRSISCMTMRIEVNDKDDKGLIVAGGGKAKYNYNVLIRDCAKGPIHPQCKQEEATRKLLDLPRPIPFIVFTTERPSPPPPPAVDDEPKPTDPPTVPPSSNSSSSGNSSIPAGSAAGGPVARAGLSNRGARQDAEDLHEKALKEMLKEIVGTVETCACETDNCNLAGSLRGISIVKLLVFPFAVLGFRAAR